MVEITAGTPSVNFRVAVGDAGRSVHQLADSINWLIAVSTNRARILIWRVNIAKGYRLFSANVRERIVPCRASNANTASVDDSAVRNTVSYNANSVVQRRASSAGCALVFVSDISFASLDELLLTASDGAGVVASGANAARVLVCNES